MPPITVVELETTYARELELGPARQNFEVLTKIQEGIRKGNSTLLKLYAEVHLGWTARGANNKLLEAAPEAAETAPPTTLPSGAALDKILTFRAKGSPRS